MSCGVISSSTACTGSGSFIFLARLLPDLAGVGERCRGSQHRALPQPATGALPGAALPCIQQGGRLSAAAVKHGVRGEWLWLVRLRLQLCVHYQLYTYMHFFVGSSLLVLPCRSLLRVLGAGNSCCRMCPYSSQTSPASLRLTSPHMFACWAPADPRLHFLAA